MAKYKHYLLGESLLNSGDKWKYTALIIVIILGMISWAKYYKTYNTDKRTKIQPVLPPKLLWANREIPHAFSTSSWQRKAFDAFRERMLLQDPQVFPCIYATKGFKANEHSYCFIDDLESASVSKTPDTALDILAAAFDEYAQNWRQLGPMTSLVVLTPLPDAEFERKPSLIDDRKRFWDLLRAISDRDPQSWPEKVPQDTGAPAWTLTFRGERFVGLALTPRYQRRQSRYCPGFVLAFQPIGIFQDLLSTSEKMASAVGKVRTLTDSMDNMPYSEDVIAVGEGKQSVSTMFFLSDDGESWGSLYSKIRSR